MELLDEREVRANLQKQLTEDFPYPLAVIKANLPGTDKRCLISAVAVCEGYFELKKQKIIHAQTSYTTEGLIFYLSMDADACELKRVCVDIEQSHPLGRLMDIDVITEKGQISRGDMGLSPRKCFLCDEDAHLCVRNQSHRPEDIERYILSRFRTYLMSVDPRTRWQRLLFTALIGELIKPRGYGCVTMSDNGSHLDMDAMLFIESANTISHPMSGAYAYPDDFQKLRDIGKIAEQAMFETTGNINTHKGAIFLMLLVMAGLQREDPVTHIAALCENILADFDNAPSSHGMSLYHKYGITGIRGLAKEGFRELFKIYYPYYLKHSLDETFLRIIGENPDTTLMHRGGMSLYNECREKVRSIASQQDRLAFDAWMKSQRLSPGGSADMLSALILMDCFMWIKEENEDEPTDQNRYRRYLRIE